MQSLKAVKFGVPIFALVALLSATTSPSRAQQYGATSGPYYPPVQKSEGRAGDADVQVIVFPVTMFKNLPPPANLEDHLTFTYNRAISLSQVQRDLLAYNKLTNKSLDDVEVTTAATPLTAARSGQMTSVTFMAQDIIQPATGHFDIAPFIEALKAYPTQRLAFVAPTGFQFTGLRSYKDSHVSINVSQGDDGRGAMYTYDVDITNPSFSDLQLPIWQAPQGQTQVATSGTNEKVRLIKIFGFVLVGSVAVLVGYVVYSTMIVRPPAS